MKFHFFLLGFTVSMGVVPDLPMTYNDGHNRHDYDDIRDELRKLTFRTDISPFRRSLSRGYRGTNFPFPKT